jgi:hypothetical protein
MSRTFEIVCHETRQTLWIGQGKDLNCFYSSNLEVMNKLGRFLQATLGKTLIVLDSEYVDSDYQEFDSDFYKDA